MGYEYFILLKIHHVAKENHVIDWDNSKILDKEEHRKTRWIKESIWIRSRNSTMNREGGAYILSHLYDPLLKKIPGGKKTSGKTSTSGDQVSRSRVDGSITSTQL